MAIVGATNVSVGEITGEAVTGMLVGVESKLATGVEQAVRKQIPITSNLTSRRILRRCQGIVIWQERLCVADGSEEISAQAYQPSSQPKDDK